jgi:hypothetical protein
VSLNELLPELMKLNHEEMVQAIELLKRRIDASDATQLINRADYENWSPFNSAETAFQLLQMIKEDEEQGG